jgi:hypothetical protein
MLVQGWLGLALSCLFVLLFQLAMALVFKIGGDLDNHETTPADYALRV